jgi:hypothetical protein
VSCNKIKLLCWYLHIHDEGEEGSGLALPSWPSPALPGPAQPCPALPCPALRLVGWGGGQRGARVEGEGGESNTQYYRPLILVRVTIYLMKFSYNISRGHYLPCNIYCLVLACIKAIFYIRPLRF